MQYNFDYLFVLNEDNGIDINNFDLSINGRVSILMIYKVLTYKNQFAA